MLGPLPPGEVKGWTCCPFCDNQVLMAIWEQGLGQDEELPIGFQLVPALAQESEK